MPIWHNTAAHDPNRRECFHDRPAQRIRIDRDEPHHIHIERDDKVAKFWLDPIRLQNSGGFNRLELRHVYSIVEENREFLMEAWNEYFGR
jgi:hypothetical protein